MANRDKLAQVPDLDMSTRLLPTPSYAPRPVRDDHGRFQTGNIGGPGRPRGSRNKLNDDFIAAIYEDWTNHGPAVLARVRKTNPTAYLRIVAALCPVRLDVETHQQLGEKTEEELLEDIVRDLDKLGVLPMIAARYEQSCLTLGPQSDERRQLPGRTENRRKLAAESSKEQDKGSP